MTERIDMIDTMRRHGRRPAIAVAATAVAAVVLAACSSSAKPSAAASSSSGAGSGAGVAGPGSAQGARPATSGQIAAISGDSMEVQNPTDGQVTVTFTATTAFTQTVTISAKAIVTGDCVSAVAAASGAAPSAATGASPTPATAITTTMVAVSAPRNGSCAGPRIATGQRQARPSGAPSSLPSASRTRGAFGALGQAVFGQVTSVSGSSLVVHEAARGTQGARDVTVTTDSATVITEQRAASAAALQVGKCISATGTANSTGAVAATRIAISNPTANGCGTTFGRFGRGTATGGGGATSGG